MDFEVELTVNTAEDGDLATGLEAQLAVIGGQADLIATKGPYRVDVGEGQVVFEIKYTYHITK
jgi:hypothetical protein